MKKPGILLICPFYSPNLGGVEAHLQLTTNYLDKHGYRVYVLTYRPLVTRVENCEGLEKKGNVTIRRFWWLSGGWFDRTTPYPIIQFLYVVPGLLLCSLFWMLKHHSCIQIIHTHGFAAAFIGRVIDLFFPGRKKIASIHFIYRRLDSGSLYRKVFKWVFSGYDRIILTSKMSEKEFLSIGIPANKLKLSRLWLDQKRFSIQNKYQCRKEIGLTSRVKLIVLFIGRMIKMKGIFNLLAAAKSLPKDILFVLVGGGPDAELLKTQSLGVKNFLYVGRVSDDLVTKYLGACDFLILPSLSEETQPMVVMEALSCGRPVAVTNKGGAKDLIDPSVGFVIEPTVKEIKKIILDCYSHPQRLRKMAIKAQPFALKNFGEANVKIITDCYFE